jgi:glycerol-3-phosphate dehydrogenase (NAD+)
MLGGNVVQQKGFDHEIRMWVFEEMVGERKLTELINERHENVKYLPGVQIPPNVRAVSELLEAAEDATILVFVVPHQVLHRKKVNELRCNYMFFFSNFQKFIFIFFFKSSL